MHTQRKLVRKLSCHGEYRARLRSAEQNQNLKHREIRHGTYPKSFEPSSLIIECVPSPAAHRQLDGGTVVHQVRDHQLEIF